MFDVSNISIEQNITSESFGLEFNPSESHSKPIRKKFFISLNEKRLKINMNQSDSFRSSSDKSEPSIQSELKLTQTQ